MASGGNHPANAVGHGAVRRNLEHFLLTLVDGRAFTVAFRHTETAIDAEPVLGFPARADTDYYRLTLRFLEL